MIACLKQDFSMDPIQDQVSAEELPVPAPVPPVPTEVSPVPIEVQPVPAAVPPKPHEVTYGRTVEKPWGKICIHCRAPSSEELLESCPNKKGWFKCVKADHCFSRIMRNDLDSSASCKKWRALCKHCGAPGIWRDLKPVKGDLNEYMCVYRDECRDDVSPRSWHYKV